MARVPKEEVARRATVAVHTLKSIGPQLQDLERTAFNRLMGHFEQGDITLERAVSILGEVKGYRQIIKSLEADIRRAEKVKLEG